MGFIYKITNKINGKCYIGKTEQSIEKRFREHISDSKRERHKERPLYRAMTKHGIENFTVELIEECNATVEREIYWIDFYKSYGSSGYNATKGGDGKFRVNHSEIINFFKLNMMTHSINHIAEIFEVDPTTVKTIVVGAGLDIPKERTTNRLKETIGRKVYCIELQKVFDTAADASRFLVNMLNKDCDPVFYTSHIVACCKGKRKSVFKHKFEYYSGEEESNRCPLEGCRHGALP